MGSKTVIVTTAAVTPESWLQWAEGKREAGHLKFLELPPQFSSSPARIIYMFNHYPVHPRVI